MTLEKELHKLVVTSVKQTQELQALLQNYTRVFQDRPGYTTLTEHHIPTEHTTQVRLPP